MKQNGLYYTLIFLCIAYIILIGKPFSHKNSPCVRSHILSESSVVINHALHFPLFTSRTENHIHNKDAYEQETTEQNRQPIAATVDVQVPQEPEADALYGEQISYLVGTFAKMREDAPQQHYRAVCETIQDKERTDELRTPIDRVNTKVPEKIDEVAEQIKLIMTALYHACNKVNAPLLIDRIEGRLHLASIVAPGILGQCFDCAVARALPRYFSQDGAFYSYRHDPYIIEDLITLLQYQYVLPDNDRKKLKLFRKDIVNHQFNKNLMMIIDALRRNDLAVLATYDQPFNPLISLMYQELNQQ